MEVKNERIGTFCEKCRNVMCICNKNKISMKTLKKVEIEPIYVEFIPEKLEENKIYISEEYKCAIHNCLCGCGEKTVMPLYSNGWNLIKENNDKISFMPSVGNYNFPCKSHYIITNNVANFV